MRYGLTPACLGQGHESPLESNLAIYISVGGTLAFDESQKEEVGLSPTAAIALSSYGSFPNYSTYTPPHSIPPKLSIPQVGPASVLQLCPQHVLSL